MLDYDQLQPEEQMHPELLQELQATYRVKPEEEQMLARVHERLERLAQGPLPQAATQASDRVSAPLLHVVSSTPSPWSARSGKVGFRRLNTLVAVLLAGVVVGSLVITFALLSRNRVASNHALSTAGIYFNRANEVYRLDPQTRTVVWHTHLTNQPVHIIANKPESVVGKPTIIDDNVYISADNMLTALDAQTGTFRWSRTFDVSVAGLWSFEDNGQLYISALFGKPALYAINSANGTTIATYTPIEGQGFWNDPTVVNGVLYYQTGDAWDARIDAVQLPSEKLLWQATLSKQQMFNGILVQDGVVYIHSQVWNGGSSPNKGRVEAFDAGNGHKIWQSPDLGSPVRTLAVATHLIYIATVSNGLMAFDRQAHTLAWQKPYDTFALQAYNTILYVGYQLGSSEGDPAVLAALNTASGQPLWQKTYGRNSSVETITVSSGIFYGLSWTGDGNQGTIYALNASSGTQLWTMPTDAGFPQWGGITIVS